MATFDYDVVIIGSAFGGSVAALRAAEKGYRVGVMEAGKRWYDVQDAPLWLTSAVIRRYTCAPIQVGASFWS
jgi:choline dehydrogenase-like flavoprotein